MHVQPQPSRRSTRWLWLKCLCLFGCLAFIAWALGDYYEQWQLAQVIAEIDASDPHWRWDAIQARRQPIPEDQNIGNAINDIVIGLRLHNMKSKMNGLPALPWKDAYVELFSRHKIENYELFLENHPNAVLPRKWKEPVEKVLLTAPAPELLEKMRQLTRYRTGRFEHVNKKTDYLMVDVQGTHTINELLRYDILLQLESGDVATCFRDVAAMLAGARVYDNGDFPVATLVRGSTARAAMRSLECILARSNSVPPDSLLPLQQAFLHEEISMPALTTPLRVSRAYYDQVLSQAQQGTITFSDFMEQKRSSTFPARKAKLTEWSQIDSVVQFVKPDLFLEPWARPHSWTRERKQMLEFSNALIQWGSQQEQNLLPELQRLKKEGIRCSPFFAALFGETQAEYQSDGGYAAYERLARGYLLHRAACRASVAALAAERYRQEQGRWPTAWDQLVPRFLSTVPLDPFTGKPLLLKTLPDGLVIYSVGPNGSDENGTVARSVPDQAALDQGIRLWNPAQRGIDQSEAIKQLEADVREESK